LERASSDNKPAPKSGLLQNKRARVAAGVILLLIVAGGVAGAIVLTTATGITNVFYFI
jgi:hypothetical protein